MPYGLRSTQEQLADHRDAADTGVAFVHVDTCLGSYLQDHHNRDGECLFGVYVDGTTTVGEVRSGLVSEVRATGDRVPSYVTDAVIASAIAYLFADYDADDKFDSRLEIPQTDEDGEPIESDMGGDEMCQAWFVLTWQTPAATLRDRDDVSSVTSVGEDRFEVTDDTGAVAVGSYDEVVAWLDAGLPEEGEAD